MSVLTIPPPHVPFFPRESHVAIWPLPLALPLHDRGNNRAILLYKYFHDAEGNALTTDSAAGNKGKTAVIIP
jgi:hypothetical protein